MYQLVILCLAQPKNKKVPLINEKNNEQELLQ